MGRLAEHWGELNTIHSFREGNTRSQFVFFSQLAENAGYSLDTEAFKPGSPLREEFVAARFYHQATTNTDRLVSVLHKAISSSTPPLQNGTAEPTSALDRMRQAGRAAADETTAAQRKAGLNITARPAQRSGQTTREPEESCTRDDGRER